MSESMIRDISLADEGLQRISWVEKFMPALNTLREEFVKEQIFKGKTIVMSIHLEAKTAYLALTLKAAGANVICTGSNPRRIRSQPASSRAASPSMHGMPAPKRNISCS